MSAGQPHRPWPYARLAYALVISAWIAYAVLTLLAPQAANARFHMGGTQLFMLRLSVIIPIHLIWFLATRGAITFKQYASLIHDGREAPGLNMIANGLLLTVAYLITITLGGAIIPFFMESRAIEFLIIIRDHIAPVLGLAISFMLFRGSQQLKAVAQFATWTKTTLAIMVGFAIFAFFFVLEFATAPNLNPGISRTSLSILPHEVLLVTLIIPNILAWFMSLLALINISRFARSVKGILYRQALQNLTYGLGTVILFMMAYQVFVFAARYFTHLSFGLALLILYIFLMLYGLGFFFVRAGAKKLTRIEAVQ